MTKHFKCLIGLTLLGSLALTPYAEADRFIGPAPFQSGIFSLLGVGTHAGTFSCSSTQVMNEVIIVFYNASSCTGALGSKDITTGSYNFNANVPFYLNSTSAYQLGVDSGVSMGSVAAIGVEFVQTPAFIISNFSGSFPVPGAPALACISVTCSGSTCIDITADPVHTNTFTFP